MKSRIPISAVLGLSLLSVAAQEITPVWVQHINGVVNVLEENRLPTLVKAGGTGDETYNANGTDLIDSYTRFLKYDDSLYLLGIRENGINESDPTLSPEQQAIAAAYPDRSIIWIDATTGKPLGVAIQLELYPVPLATQSTTDFFGPKFGITDGPHGEKVLYTGYKYKVLRYAPAGLVDDPNFPNQRATWNPDPTEAWIEPVPDEPSGDGSSGGDGSTSWRMKAFRVSGHGATTRLWIGGGSWRASMQPQELATEDGGLTFIPVARMNDRTDNVGDKGQYSQGGQPSSIVAYPVDSARPGLEVAYHPHYPGAGWETRPTRHTKNPNGDGVLPRNGGTGRPDFFEMDAAGSDTFPAFNWEAAGKDGLPINHKADGVEHYDGNWVMSCDTKDGLDYVVTYAIPSWNQQFGSAGDPSATFKPAWIGVHTLDGSIASGQSAFKLPVYETDEPIVDPNGNGGTGHDYGYDGDVEVYPVEGEPGRSLVLWSGGIYGFGVFSVANVPASILTEPSDVTVAENAPVTLSAEVAGSPNKYQWRKDGEDLDATDPNFTRSISTGVNKSTLALAGATAADAGRYQLMISNPAGDLQTREAVLTVESDTTPPELAAASSRTGNTGEFVGVTVTFSEPVTPESASVASAYTVSGGVTVQDVRVVNPTTVMLKTTALEPGLEYTVTGNGIRDLASGGGNAMQNSQTAFKGSSLLSGYAQWHYFPDITGTSVDSMFTDPNVPGLPAQVEFLTSFSTGTDFSNYAEQFGGSIAAFLTPTETGSYRFFIRSDDASELWLSTDDSIANIRLIAKETGCCNAFQEPGADQTSDPQSLVAGQRYLLVAYYKEGTGGDYCHVAWRQEGDATPPGDLTPIPGSVLSSYHPGLPPTFEPPVIEGDQVVLRWTGTGVLQESADLVNWTDVSGNPGSPASIPFSPTTPHMFFRIAQ